MILDRCLHTVGWDSPISLDISTVFIPAACIARIAVDFAGVTLFFGLCCLVGLAACAVILFTLLVG